MEERTAEKSKIKMKNERKRKELIFICVMLAIPIVQHFVFFLYPNINSLFLAFQNEQVDGTLYWTLANFKFIFDELFSNVGIIRESISNTMIFWLFNSVFMYVLGYIWSYFLWKRIRGRAFFRVVFYVCAILGTSVVAAIFKFMIRDNGLIGIAYKAITGVESVPAFFLEKGYSLQWILIFVFWTGFGGNYIIFGGAYEKIPEDLVEYSMIDGITNMWQELRYLVLPLTWPTFSTLFLINVGAILSATGPILLLTNGAGGTSTLSYWIFIRIQTYQSYYQPAALGLLMTIVTLPIFGFSRWLVRKKESVEY